MDADENLVLAEDNCKNKVRITLPRLALPAPPHYPTLPNHFDLLIFVDF